MANRLFGILLAAIGAGASAVLYSRLPSVMVVGFSDGDASGRLVAAFAMPATILLVWGLMHALPRIDPLGRNYARFEATYWRLANAAFGLLFVLHALTLARGLGVGGPTAERAAYAAAGMALAIVGNFITRVQPNWFVGIRTPWTLSSETVWRKTHRLAGWLLVASGLVTIGLSFGPVRPIIPTLAVAFAITAGTSLLYSFVVWNAERRAGGEPVSEPRSAEAPPSRSR